MAQLSRPVSITRVCLTSSSGMSSQAFSRVSLALWLLSRKYQFAVSLLLAVLA